MLTIETKKLEISDKSNRKVEMVCRFTNTKANIENGCIKRIKETNVAYVRPHVIIIKNNKYLMFEESDYIFINGYEKKIMFIDLENYIKSN